MIERIKALTALIPGPGALCGTFGSAEKEVIVGQTLHACVANDAEHGTPFSMKGKNLQNEDPMARNRSAYAELLRDGFLCEVKADLKGKPRQVVIVPTEMLLDYLESRLVKKGAK